MTIGQPTTSNIASWLSKFWKNIERAFPSLTTEEKIRVVLSRLPNQYATFLISSECSSKKELFKTVGVLFAYGALDRANAMQRFFSVSPRRGSTLLSFVSELLDLSISLDLPRNNRHVLVLRRLLIFLPFYFRNIVGDKLEQVVKNGEKVVITAILQPILEDKGATAEIERIFRNGGFMNNPNALQMVQNRPPGKNGQGFLNGGQSGQNNQIAGMIPQSTPPTNLPKLANVSAAPPLLAAPQNTPRVTIVCRKCGGYNHKTFQCLLYYKESPFPCPNCLRFFGAKHFHHIGLCRANTKN